MTERTQCRWQKQAGPEKQGRPAHSQQELDQARPRVLEVLHTLGFRTGRPTATILLPDVPTRVLNILLKVLKAEHRQELNESRRKDRAHVEVLATGAMAVQDSTHTGSFKVRKSWAEVSKDAATTEAYAFGNGKPLTGKAMLEHLKALKKAEQLPLVLGIDNGPGNKDIRVQKWATENQLVLLYNRPHTPTDNARAERCIGEGKALAGLGTGVRHDYETQGVLELNQALQIINQRWPRTSKGGLTAAQLKKTLPHWKDFTARATFYRATRKAIHESTAGLTGRVLRRETREAIFRTLEQFGLILRWRGDLKPAGKNQDRIS